MVIQGKGQLKGCLESIREEDITYERMRIICISNFNCAVKKDDCPFNKILLD